MLLVVGNVATESEQEAIGLLQQLGLKEYEARCFVALTRLPSGTAKDIADIATVPRTRVYDAVRVLESEGLLEIQHTNPQRFRALSIEEATALLDDRYSSRIDTLQQTLQNLEGQDDTPSHSQEVWSLSGREAITARTQQILSEADDEIILVVGSENTLSTRLYEPLEAATDRGIDVIVGALTSSARNELRERIPAAEVFETELDWLQEDRMDQEETPSIGVILMVDRDTLLVSSQTEHGFGEERTESAIFGSGFSNGLVVIARRLLARGLQARKDPAT